MSTQQQVGPNEFGFVLDGTPDFPARLYKFTERVHAASMIERGQVRIGTLYDYRDPIKYAGGVLDRDEGKLSHLEEIAAAHLSQLTPYSQGIMAQLGAGPDSTFERVAVKANVSEPNRYIYCCSLSPSWDINLEPKYDVCVEIFAVGPYIKALGKCLVLKNRSNGLVGLGSTSYSGREHTTRTLNAERVGDPPARPALLKPLSLVWQQEYRAIFIATTDDVTPDVYVNPEIKHYCRIHSVRP